MHEILLKTRLNAQTVRIRAAAPHVARKCEAGQFVILRVDGQGERVPLTIADYDRASGTIDIIFQEIGASTKLLGSLEKGGFILDIAGPLGLASHLDGVKNACVVGGGLGCAIAYPQAKKLYEAGANVDIIAGFRNKDLIILENDMRAVCENLHIMTDDGTAGEKGFVTDKLKSLLENGKKYDMVIAIGPLVMMKFVSFTTKPFAVKTMVSMNPIMVDGTGMCGGCRITVGGKVKFACVDGPDFDGHQVDFDETIRRNAFYREEEAHTVLDLSCRTGGGLNG